MTLRSEVQIPQMNFMFIHIKLPGGDTGNECMQKV